MRFFLDANVLVYGAVPSEYRDPSLEILRAIARGEADGRTSTAVLEEVWHLELSGRAGAIAGLTQRAYSILSPLLPVTDDAFRVALSLPSSQLGANDRVHAGTCLAHGIEVILSADAGFDRAGSLRRVDPLDDSARGALLSAGAD